MEGREWERRQGWIQGTYAVYWCGLRIGDGMSKLFVTFVCHFAKDEAVVLCVFSLSSHAKAMQNPHPPGIKSNQSIKPSSAYPPTPSPKIK